MLFDRYSYGCLWKSQFARKHTHYTRMQRFVDSVRQIISRRMPPSRVRVQRRPQSEGGCVHGSCASIQPGPPSHHPFKKSARRAFEPTHPGLSVFKTLLIGLQHQTISKLCLYSLFVLVTTHSVDHLIQRKIRAPQTCPAAVLVGRGLWKSQQENRLTML